jgi:hypothetical protein
MVDADASSLGLDLSKHDDEILQVVDRLGNCTGKKSRNELRREKAHDFQVAKVFLSLNPVTRLAQNRPPMDT